MKTLAFLGVAALSMGAMAAPVVVAAQVTPSTDNLEIAKAIYTAVASGDYLLVAALALILLVAFLKWLAPKLHDSVGDFLNSDAGGALLVLLSSYGAALSTAHMAGAGWTWGLARTAAVVALTAAGGYSVLKKLFAPVLSALWGKLFK
jgi:hypothetical protein